MAVALIGLVGIVAGALDGGWMNSRLERRRRLDDARDAQHLVAAELEDAARHVRSVREADDYSSLSIPEERWKKGAKSLSGALDWDLYKRLNTSYGLIDAWNSEAASRKRDGASALSGQEREEFEDGEGKLQRSSELLRGSGLKARPGSRVLAVTGGVSVLLVAAVVGIAILVPRPDLTDQTIASALQSKLGDGSLVSCAESKDAWTCHASLPARRAPVCGVQAGSGASPSRDRPIALIAKPRCSKLARSSETFEVAEGADGLVARSAHAIRATNQLRSLDEAEESTAKSLWERLIGKK